MTKNTASRGRPNGYSGITAGLTVREENVSGVDKETICTQWIPTDRPVVCIVTGPKFPLASDWMAPLRMMVLEQLAVSQTQ